MPFADAERWDARYREEAGNAAFERPRSFLVEHAGLLPRKGLAFDAAMGLGGNAGFLLERGLKVIGVDISIVALRKAKMRLTQLQVVQADLTRFYLPSTSFDVILNFFYLQRDLWEAYTRALKPGGILIFETLTQDMLIIHPEIDPKYLLAPGELRHAFDPLEILDYREGWSEGAAGHTRATAGLVARARL